MSKKQKLRLAVANKYGMRCGYCGDFLLQNRYQLDHIIPRSLFNEHVSHRRQWVPDFLKHLKPGEQDHIDNLMPSCAVCNGSKMSHYLEFWREELSMQLSRAKKTSYNYRMAHKYGQVMETPKPVVFYFETVSSLNGKE